MNETFSGETYIQMNPLDSLRDLELNNLESFNNNLDLENQKNGSKIPNKSNNNSNNCNNYKQIKNSDLTNSKILDISNNLFNSDLDNTLNLDTKAEEKLDNIILQKLNQKNHDLDFELQEAKDYNFISRKDTFNNNSDYSPRFSEETDREFFEKIIIDTKNPIEKFYSKNYKYVRCDNVTTLKINDQKFSFLTNPINQNDLYFIKFSNLILKFEIEDFNTYNKNLLKYTRIPYQIIKKFTYSMNKNLLGLEVEIKRIKFFYAVNFLIKCFLFFLIFFSSAVWFSINGDELYALDKTVSRYFPLVLCLSFIIILTYSIYRFKKSRMIDYHINKFLMKKQEEIDPILYKWNAEYFIDKMDYLAVMTRTLNYIMIIMKPNKKILLKDHEFN